MHIITKCTLGYITIRNLSLPLIKTAQQSAQHVAQWNLLKNWIFFVFWFCQTGEK